MEAKELLTFPSDSDGKESPCSVRPGFSLWRRERLLTSVFLPGESLKQRSLLGYI